MNLTVKSSTPTVNTAYEDDIYAIKLSVDGGFPDGSYAEIDGIRYYSNNGCITVSPLASGGFMSELYSPLPITSVGGRSAFRVELLPGVSSSSNPTAKSVTAEFDCIDTTVCALDADLSEKVFEAGWITDAAITLRSEKVEAVTLTISRKNADGSYTEVMRNIVVDLPNDNSPFSIVLGNGFQASSGETYMFSFVGYVKDTPVCRDDCCIAIGY